MTSKQSETHIEYILSGKMIIKSPNGTEIKVGPGDVFEIVPEHDAWVNGNEPCIALDFENLEKKIIAFLTLAHPNLAAVSASADYTSAKLRPC